MAVCPRLEKNVNSQESATPSASLSSIRNAGALVTLPEGLVSTTRYSPSLFVLTFGRITESLVAPPMLPPLKRH